MLDMMSTVQRIWEEEGWSTVIPAAALVAGYHNNALILKAEGWSKGDFVETCKLLMGKYYSEVEEICKARGWEVPHYAAELAS
jgi:hypothetical protein